MTTINTDRERALAIIRDLREQHHSYSFIAEALTRAGVPPLSGKAGATWNRGTVFKLASQARA